jgi:lysozyme family protein
MSVADDRIVDAILVREGGEVAPPDRSGRISRWGITAKVLADYRHQPDVSDDEIKNLSATEARAIYKQEFIYAPSFHMLGSDELRAVLVDYGVNSGPERAVRALQHVLGLSEDGIIGGETVHAANIKDGSRLAGKVLAQRQRFVCGLVVKDPTQLGNLVGWTERVQEQVEALV